jgi:riboflavin synthase
MIQKTGCSSMFSGIIETMGIVKKIDRNGSNKSFYIESKLTPELKVDQSISHNGVCLTVEELLIKESQYRVTAIEETLSKTMLGNIQVYDHINLERSVGGEIRFDGHFVQGHVDCTGVVERIVKMEGSYEFWISFPADDEPLVVDRGSVALNGISLTIAKTNPELHQLMVAIIPYTYENTNISRWKPGDKINLEYDILGKYVLKIVQKMKV